MLLPSDDAILLSLINTKLRDEYSSPEELCGEEGIDMDELTSRLFSAGYEYSAQHNAFLLK